jgi:PRTRC genetic system protein A
MSLLADNPTDLAVLEEVPCWAVPPSGRSAALDALRARRAGHGFAVGRDGVMLILRRPWLVLDVLIHPPSAAYLPYGSVGDQRADLVCGLIPAEHYDSIVSHLRAALPNEAAAFVLWNEDSREFRVEFPTIEHATSSRLVYRPPSCPAGWHIVCDIHSHGRGGAFFSSTDDEDDAHSTKIAVVFGKLDRATPSAVARICAAGMFLPLPRIPFAGVPYGG